MLREAGEASAQRAPATALRWYSAALRLTPPGAAAEQRIELHGALAGAYAAVGQFGEARAALLEILGLLPSGASLPRARLTAACAGVEQLLGQHNAARSRLREALAAVGDEDSAEAVELSVSLALNAFFRQEYEEGRRWGDRAVTLATPMNDVGRLAVALAASALCAAFAGAATEAGRIRQRASEMIDAMSDSEVATRLDALAFLATSELYLDEFAASQAHAERGLAVARATGQGELLPLLIPTIATAQMVRGGLGAAAELLDAAIEGDRLTGNAQALVWNLLNRSYVASKAGDIDRAMACAEESVNLTRPLDESMVTMYAEVCLAVACLMDGDPARAAELFMASAGGEDLSIIPGGWRAHYLDLATVALLATGRREEAARVAGHAEAVAAATGLPMAAAWAGRAAAAVALDADDPERAAERALASADAAAGADAPLEAAISRLLAGRALAAGGRGADATAELERAAHAFEEHGARRYREEAERELRRLGRRIHRRTSPGDPLADGVGSLTERELQVARLIADHRTNPEIAAELFLSKKTVETHVRNMFRKLGVSSRNAIARAVESADRQAAVQRPSADSEGGRRYIGRP